MLSIVVVSPAMAKEDPLEFLHLLQKDYPDVAIDYLDQLKIDPNAPKAIMDLWDLEMSRAKKEAARHAYSAAQGKQWTDESKALLEKFIKANPDRAEAIQEAARWSEQRALEGQYAVLRATYTSDTGEKAKLLTDARKIFEEIRPQFEKALKASEKLLGMLPPNADRRKREEARIMVGESRLTLAMVEFYLAQTREEGSQRSDALTKSINDFDAIYHDFQEVFLGWRAHFWHARILQELGKIVDAKDIYEEVVARDERNIDEADDPKQAARSRTLRKTGLEPFFSEVEQYYLQTLYRLSKKEYLEEIETWRPLHRANSEKCTGYQALTLEYARNLLAIGEQSKDEVKKKLAKERALKLLGEMAKILSPYQQDAIKLRRELNPKVSAEEGFEDAVIDGDAALERKKWAEAVEFYEKAVAVATPKVDKVRLAAVENTLVACYHNLALQLHKDGKVEDAIAVARKALKGRLLQTKAAPGVAVFLLNAQYYQYMGAVERNEAEKTADWLAKVSNTAKSILSMKEWAAKEEGDSARIILLRLALAKDNVAEADKILSAINPNSREYPKALMVMGFQHWDKYRRAKRQINADTGKRLAIDRNRIAKRDEDRKQAVDYMEKAVDIMNKIRADTAVMTEALRDSQLLLAEIYREGEDFKRSAPLFQGLIDDLVKDSGRTFDETSLRIFDGGGQAYLKLGDIAGAAAVGAKFLELGPDQAPVNLRIMSFAKGLDTFRKRAMDSDSADPARQTEGASTLKTVSELEEKTMINLCKRKKISPASMVWIVKTTSNLGTDEAKAAAVELIESIIDKASEDQNFNKDVKPALAGLQSLGAIIQAQRGQYAKAKDLIDQLIQTYPRALDPQLSEAKILTEWAAKDASKYAEAINKWDTLRMKLERAGIMDTKGKVNPKYEVIFNEADCFYRMSQKTNNKEEVRKAMELLGPYLNLDPNIQTPSDEYREISAKYFRLGGKLAEVLSMPPPVRASKAKGATTPGKRS